MSKLSLHDRYVKSGCPSRIEVGFDAVLSCLLRYLSNLLSKHNMTASPPKTNR